MVVLIPLVVFVVLDKRDAIVAMVVSSVKSRTDDLQTQQPFEKKPPVITGVAQPKNKTAAILVSTTEPSMIEANESSSTAAPSTTPLSFIESNATEPPTDQQLPQTTDEPSSNETKQSTSKAETAFHSTNNHVVDTDDCFCTAKNHNSKRVQLSFEAMKESNFFCPPKVKRSQCHCQSTVEAAPQCSSSSSSSTRRIPTRLWQAAFEKNMESAKSMALSSSLDNDTVVLLGDDITGHLTGRHIGVPKVEWKDYRIIFDKLFTRAQGERGGEGVNGLALGISGDRCAQLLYRLRNGEMPSTLTPNVWWILIGTSDLSDSCSPKAILMGIIGIVREIQRRRPNAIIVINGILPRPRNSKGTRMMSLLWTKIDQR